MQDLDWDDFRYVLAISRSKSMAAASRLLSVNETTVGRRLSRIEDQLGLKIFERLDGVLVATESGRAVIDGAERMELETHNIDTLVSGADFIVAGTVRLTAVPIMLNHVLVPQLPQLSEAHPDLRIELVAESRDLSLMDRQADIAIRLARPTKEGRVLAHRIGQFDYSVYAASKNQALLWITFEDGMRNLPQSEWIRDRVGGNDEKTSLITVNDGESVLACVRAGLGKSLLPVAIGNADSTLVRLDPEVCISREIWLMIHPELRHLARVKVVVDWLKQIFGEDHM